jgi:phosphonate transport system substrate-binding protein
VIRFASYLSPNLNPVYEAAAAAVGDHLGVKTELVTEGDYEAFRSGRDDVSFICSLAWLELAGDMPAVAPIAAPVLAGDRYHGRPIYYSDVVVRTDSPYVTFSDLRDRTWAYNEKQSQSGYGVTRHHLLQLGETTGFFGEVVAAGHHLRCIDLVRDGAADAAAIDSQVLAVAAAEDPSLHAALRVIASLGPSTIQPVVAGPRVDAAGRAGIVAALTGMHRDPRYQPVLSRGLVARFVAITSADYDDVRRMRQACETAGFVDFG